MTNARDQIYMLDTNVFSDVLDGKISPEVFAGDRLFVIGVQIDEIQATKKIERRESLLAVFAVFKDIAPTSLRASSFAFDIEGAGFNQAHWNDGSGNFDKMLSRLQTLESMTIWRRDS
jgi:predicted nucleic acid-binding protein